MDAEKSEVESSDYANKHRSRGFSDLSDSAVTNIKDGEGITGQRVGRCRSTECIQRYGPPLLDMILTRHDTGEGERERERRERGGGSKQLTQRRKRYVRLV